MKKSALGGINAIESAEESHESSSIPIVDSNFENVRSGELHENEEENYLE